MDDDELAYISSIRMSAYIRLSIFVIAILDKQQSSYLLILA